MAHRKRFHPRAYAQIIKDQGGTCAGECGEALELHPKAIEFDHIVELWRGGRDEPSNLQAMCRGCHRAKTRREAAELAKTRRIERAQHMGGKLNRHDRMLAKFLEEAAG